MPKRGKRSKSTCDRDTPGDNVLNADHKKQRSGIQASDRASTGGSNTDFSVLNDLNDEIQAGPLPDMPSTLLQLLSGEPDVKEVDFASSKVGLHYIKMCKRRQGEKNAHKHTKLNSSAGSEFHRLIKNACSRCCLFGASRRENREDFVDEKDAVTALLETVNTAAEKQQSASIILAGPPGCGKTALVDAALAEVKRKYTFPGVLVVRLNGASVNSDTAALREIASQLVLEDELNATIDMRQELNNVGKAECNLSLLFDVLRKSRIANQPVIFVLDAVDRFAALPKQSLLYNLLDLTQHTSMRLAVIGLTTQVNILFSFEKRVRSRFSQRLICMHGINTCQRAVRLLWNKLAARTGEAEEDALRNWNKGLENWLCHPRTAEWIRMQCLISRDARPLLKQAIAVVSALSDSAGKSEWSCTALADQSKSWPAELDGLSLLELCVIGAAIRLERRELPCTMASLAVQYNSLVRTGGLERFDDGVVAQATERLVQREILVMSDEGSSVSKTRKEFRPLRVVPSIETVCARLKGGSQGSTVMLPDKVIRWAAEDEEL